MQARKFLSMILALALLVSVIAPCSNVVHADKVTLYGENLEQVTEPVIGESYYLGADVGGTMVYFSHSTFTNTAPYALYTRTDFTHKWTVPMTLESPEALVEDYSDGFQMVYTYVKSDETSVTSRIYCIDQLKDATVAGQTGVMDTAASDISGEARKNRHNFFMDDEDHWIRSTYKNDHVLVAKKLLDSSTSKEAWRMLFVPETELANEGVYPVMMLKEHVHAFSAATTTGCAATRSCTTCGYTETAYDQKVQVVDPVVGESYYLAANVAGVLKYFTTGTVTNTAPYSLVTTEQESTAVQVTLEDSLNTSEKFEGGFQFTFLNNSAVTRIYCMDVLKDATTAGQTGVMDTGTNSSTPYKNRHSFWVDEVDGVKVLRKYGNNNILVVKLLDSDYRMLGVPESELANEGVYPVMLLEEHTHEASKTVTETTDSAHIYGCWCGGIGKSAAHTYGKSTHNMAAKITTRTCTVCGYTAAVHGYSQAQVKHPTIGETYNLTVNKEGEILSFITGSYTKTKPYSIITGTDLKTVTVQAALETGKGEFQLVYNDGTNDYCVYSVTDGVGLSKSASYVSDPTKVSFLMDEVNGVRVLRAYGTQQILAAKWNDATSLWRIFPVAESEIGTDGVYPVMLTTANTAHTQHTYETEWTFNKENGTQSHLCAECGAPKDILYGTDTKASQVTAPVIGNQYHIAANVAGKLYFFRHGTVSDTVPYSLVVTDNVNHSWAFKLTVEDPSAVSDATVTTGFQLTYPHPTVADATARIYCIDTLKDDTVAGQTDIMDTGANTTAAFKNRHNFFINEADGTIRSTYKTDHVLVVMQVPQTVSGVTTNVWRMLFIPEADMTAETYPVMFVDVHEHAFGEEVYGEENGHYHKCDCESKSDVISHSFGTWTLDRVNQKQTATCEVCDYQLTVASPYYDAVESEEELTNGLAETVLDEETGAYTVSGGKDYYLMAEIGDDFYYFRNTGSGENTSSTVSDTTGHSLYTTNDPSHDNIIKAKVTPGNTENTYVIHAGKAVNRVVYIRDESADSIMDTGMTAFNGVSTNATYKARSEFMWDEENGRLYQLEDDVKYVLVMKQMTNTKTSQTEWRMVGVPEAEANAAGNYPVVLANHVHNLSKEFQADGATYYRACGCGYHATVTGGIALGETVGIHFDVKLEEGETLTATVAGEKVDVPTENGSAFIPLAAAQMTDEVKLTVGEDALDVAFTIRGFADAILADESYNQYAKDLVNHMLVYGSAAQNYFDHNTGALAGEGVNATVDVPEEPAGVQVQSDLEGVEYYGASVIHEGVTAVRFYFKAASVEGLTFTVDGNVCEPTEMDGMYYIEVPCGNPQNMDQDMTALVTNGQQNLAVQYSPLNYIVRTYNREDASAELKELAQAMYGYHKAAKTYIANMYLGSDFALKSQTVTSLYEGVDQYASTYVAAGDEVKAYAIVVSADANVELKVSAGAWGADSTAENPGETKTVANHFRAMKNAGNNVLAMINGGFFDLNKTKTMKPYGMQIVDGVVKQAPAAGNYSDTWFGMTKDGKYVISDAAGYESTYIGNVQQGVGGGKLLIVGGQVQDITSTRDYRTAVGVNAKGDLVLVAVESATYSDVCQIFVDLGLDIVTVLNLDGGGSTAMYVPGAFYPKALILGEDGLLPREVADAVGIVVKQ